MSKSISVTVTVVLLLGGCVLVASVVTIGAQRAQMHQVQVAATAEAKRIEVISTMEAEKAKADQIREIYDGQAEVIGVEADAYVQKRSVDMTFYALQKSEERQDEMLYFVLNGESKQKTETRVWTICAAVIAAVVVVLVVGTVVWSNWAQIVGIAAALRNIRQM